MTITSVLSRASKGATRSSTADKYGSDIHAGPASIEFPHSAGHIYCSGRGIGFALPHPTVCVLFEHFGKCCLLGVLLVFALGSRSEAQIDQFLPEVDAYYKVSSPLRIWFQAKETGEEGAPVTAEIGPSFDFYVKSPLKLADVTAFDLDDSKSRFLVVSVGYRYLPTPNTAPTNRFEPFFTLNYPIPKIGLAAVGP